MKKKQPYLIPILIIGALFFIFGFVSWLNGILIPYLQIACELSDFQALLVAFSFYIAYTIMSLPSAWVLKKTGFKSGMMIGLWVMAIGTLIFIPAAMSRTYFIFLTGLFVMGSGLALLQTATNPYITIIGPRESAARRISIMGICNKVAGAVAPLILAYYVLNDGDAFVESIKIMSDPERIAALDGLARRVINPYIVMTIVLVLMGVGIRISPLPKIDFSKDDDENSTSEITNKTSILQFPHLILGAIVLFLYLGAEVIAADTIIRYGMSLGIVMDKAKVFTSYTMGFMVIGYLLGIVLIPKIMSQRFALKLSGILGIVFTFGIVFTNGFVSAMFVALLGLANALVWPTVWPLAIKGLGKFTNTGSALLVMAISGGAIVPLFWGLLSDNFNTQTAYWMLIPLYLSVWYYSIWGCKLKAWKPVN